MSGTPVAPQPAPAVTFAPSPRVTPLAPQRYALQVTLGQQAHDKLRHAQALAGHAPGDLAGLFEAALDAYIAQLEKRRCAATTRPGRRRSNGDGRSVPAEVRRAVWQRDGGRCTFVSEQGRRCEAQAHLELDHIEPVAKGGCSTAGNLRLRCRAHNQFAAEQVFGTGFIQARREQAKQRAAEARLARERAAALARQAREEAARARQEREQAAAERQQQEELVPWLRGLGLRPAEAKGAAVRCVAIADRPLEARVKHALSLLSPPCTRRRYAPGRPPSGW